MDFSEPGQGKGMDNDSKAERIRQLERRNKGLILGIFGAAGVLAVAMTLVVILQPSARECDNSDELSTIEAAAAKKSQDLKIGLLFASKGNRSSRERSLKEATLMAIKEVNDFRTALRVSGYHEDTESSPDKALMAFKKLYNEQNVKFFVGLSNSEALKVAAWAETNANDTLILTPHATNTELTKYPNVIQLSMTNQALAYAFHSKLTEAGVSELIPIVQDDVHSLEIIEELNSIAESLMNKLYVVKPIKYSPGSLEKNADEVLSEVKAALSVRPNASIFLVGESNTKFILEAAYMDSLLLRRMWYASDSLALNYAALNSSKALNTSQTVSLYSLIYAGDQFAESTKRGCTFANLSETLNEPPLPQAAMAYDAIQILYNTVQTTNSAHPTLIKRELKNKEEWGSGLSGQISIDANGQRISGEYLRVVVLPNIPDQSKVQVVMNSKWYIDGTIRVSKADGAMARVLSMSSSHSLKMSSGAIVNKSELLNLEGSLNTNCTDARLRVETIDPFSHRKVVKDYTKDTLPEVVILPSVYGYQMHITCQIPTGELTYAVACSANESPQENSECVALLTKPNGRRKLLLEDSTAGALATCGGVSVGCAACGIILGVATLGISAAACLVPCLPGIAGSCTAAVTLTIKDTTGTVICTELLEQGQIPLHLYLQDVSFGKRLGKENGHVFKGYHLLAKPIVWLMRRSNLVTEIVKTFALPWAEEMSYLEGGSTTSNIFGSMVMKLGIPLCTVVGYLVEIWEAVAARLPWGITVMGSFLIFGVPLYHFKNVSKITPF